MFTTFDKAIAGGAAAWITTGVAAVIAAITGHPLDPTLVAAIGTGIGALLVFIVPNKTA